ncbi:hypothetical protein P280DRAFT_497337 [Massarina eburnea CBS 473.64]|uniref:Flap structure-specific endonuclease n=1 Tax=Massarina eburnea CBS 473.64 TaxID=1395130 RepID=A0A6A6S3M7_9PLEO|nr:hypothetical protein P280DRAFT_497337 [Massarina eburnea CBS 473.64]
MGIHGIYKEIGPGQRVALSKLAVAKFEETARPLRIAIDTSIWLFQIQASKGGSNPALRTFYYRLLRLIALSIHPVFVFDGPNKPPFKRNKRTGPNVASIPEFLAKQLLKQFGFPIHLAPGEAEAECALLQREGIVDAVLSEDVDTLMFGSSLTIRNWSPEQKTGKTPTHVNVYDAVETKNGPSGLDREGMVLIALMSGGDYVPEGVPGIGIKTACEAARAGFGHDLCKIAKKDKTAMREWRERLLHELKTNESKLFSRKKPSVKFPDDFPRTDILGYYTHPAISSQAGLDKLKRSITWDQDLDFAGLRDFACDAFDWVNLEGAKHFIRSLAPSLLVRHLRMRGEQTARFSSEDVHAIEEDEALLVKAIHGKRQHAITDCTTELRVSFIPIGLVKIDLSTEEPDEDINSGPPGSDDDAEELEIDDDEGPKKRGPTKFDPEKPARVWVMETYAKVGVPLQVQDWEAKLQSKEKPKAKRAASANTASKPAPKPRGTRRTKTASDAPQVTIERFAKVTKPGAKLSRSLAKAQTSDPHVPNVPTKPTTQTTKSYINLLSPSPAKPTSTITQPPREKSLSLALPDLPPSVTKRRKRGPIQRSHTLPIESPSHRPDTPPLDTIECLDLVDTSIPPSPSPSQLPTKKPRTRVTRPVSTVRPTTSPEKTRQTTLDTWRSPTKSRKNAAPEPILAPPPFRISRDDEVEALDLTFSPPVERTRGEKPVTLAPRNPRRTIADIFSAATTTTTTTTTSRPRPPLVSISSNASQISTISSSPSMTPTSHSSQSANRETKTKPREKENSNADTQPCIREPARTRTHTSPHLCETEPLSLADEEEGIDCLDLTDLTSSPALPRPPPTRSQHPSEPPLNPPLSHSRRTKSLEPEPEIEIDSLDLTHLSSPSFTPPPSRAHIIPTFPASPCRQSPKIATSMNTEAASKSPAAAWKSRAKKKRAIVIRRSLAGAWTYVDADMESPAKGDGGKGLGVKMGWERMSERERRRWRESEIEILDMT